VEGLKKDLEECGEVFSILKRVVGEVVLQKKIAHA